MKALITRKLGMTSVVQPDGNVDAITLLSAEDNTVSQLKTTDKDGYQSLQLARETKKPISKPLAGHLKAAKANSNIIREFKFHGEIDYKVGDKISADLFSEGDMVDVQAVNKGKGFAGTIKRHNFKLGRKTHGGSSYRKPGSIGSMYPQKIFKGKKMAGQMGHKLTTIKNLKVVMIDNENKVIGVKGAVPGPKKTIVLVRGVK